MAAMGREADVPECPLARWQTVRMKLLWVYERRLTAGEHPGEYDFQSAIRVEKGWIEAGSTRRNAARATAGEWLILPQGRRWQRIGEGCEVFSAGFRFRLPGGGAVYERGLPVVFAARSAPALDRSSRSLVRIVGGSIGLGYASGDRVTGLREYVRSQEAFGRFLVCLSERLAAAGVGAESLVPGNAVVDAALELLGTSPTGGPGRTAEIAARVGVAPGHLDRLVVAATGRTLRGHAEARRLEAAQDALRDGRASLKEVAFRLGFATPSHFNNWFRRRTGTTPGAFRENRRSGVAPR